MTEILGARRLPGGRRRSFALMGAAAFLAAVLTVSLLVAPNVRAQDPGATSTLVGVRAPGPYDPYSLGAMKAWQGKTNAVAVFFRKTNVPATEVFTKLTSIWNEGSVPMYSIELVDSNATIARGSVDARIDAVAHVMKTFLSGPDLVYGNADDRRAYMRLAWEANGTWYPWAPCHAFGGTAEDYRAMWRHYHDRYALLGIDNTHLAWVFSVNQTDKGERCRPEALYPGDEYVDWTGIDGYTWSHGQGPNEVFGPMAARLRAIAPSKPLSINEAGAHTAMVGGKSAYITAYFDWIRAHDVRMALWFNTDKEKDWAVFGGLQGDEVFRSGPWVYRGWSAYRSGVASDRIVGSNAADPRLLTDQQFLGR